MIFNYIAFKSLVKHWKMYDKITLRTYIVELLPCILTIPVNCLSSIVYLSYLYAWYLSLFSSSSSLNQISGKMRMVK